MAFGAMDAFMGDLAGLVIAGVGCSNYVLYKILK